MATTEYATQTQAVGVLWASAVPREFHRITAIEPVRKEIEFQLPVALWPN
jgi:hypothetical protein